MNKVPTVFERSGTYSNETEAKMTKTILVIDDEERLVSLVKAYLVQEGFQVVTASNGQEGLQAARNARPDLIILDLMMPVMDGYEFMRLQLRERETPIILLTARVEDTDKVLGLELGADDYVTKPFSPRELVARVRAVLRRLAPAGSPSPHLLCVGSLSLDPAGHIVRLAGRPIDLTPSEFDLLAVLLANPGRAFSRLELLEKTQGTAYEGYERTINAHIKNLRAKVESDPRQPRYLETVYGIGYRLATQ